MSVTRLSIMTAVALVAFAGNSVLCRVALKGELIDANLFTAVRIISGALAWFSFYLFQNKAKQLMHSGTLAGGLSLAIYMVSFSWAYLDLDTGVGALILFGLVQITMVVWSIARGEVPSKLQVSGLTLALIGLAWLLLVPGVGAPALSAGLMMATSGVAWGAYTLLGQASTDPVRDTAGNFLRASPVALLIIIVSLDSLVWSSAGLVWAVMSGVLASATGYAIWYMVLRELSATRAAGLQLVVPVLASFGGLLFASEQLTGRLLSASALILGGVALVLKKKRVASR